MSDVLGEPGSRFFISDGLRLHYADWGNEAAPPLILLHGGRDHCRNWDWVAARFRHDFHVMAPDLRGHGDSAWAVGSSYPFLAYLYDLAQFIHQLDTAQVTIMAHSLGAGISLRYAGLYPDKLRKLVAVEGLGPTRVQMAAKNETAERLRSWIEATREMAGRGARRYAEFEDALKRMQEQHPRLTPDQIRHLTVHGARRNEDGTYSWKFDPYVATRMPVDLAQDDVETLWAGITCPTMLMFGAESWAASPEGYRRAGLFETAEVVTVQDATHWVHHNQLDRFMEIVTAFL